jgi:hypothetical protein
MKHYKKLLLDKLSQCGWELTSQEDGAEWWLEEIWPVKSTSTNWGYELLISFLVDPQYAGTKKSQSVWLISATEELPDSWTKYNECSVAQMNLVKGKFDEKLSQFVELVNIHRNLVNL